MLDAGQTRPTLAFAVSKLRFLYGMEEVAASIPARSTIFKYLQRSLFHPGSI